MRAVPLVVLLAGCRGLFGFDDPVVVEPSTIPSVEFVAASTTADEASNTITIDVSLSHASEQLVAVDFDVVAGSASDPADYTLDTNDTLLFQPGQLTKQIALTIVSDGLEEELEEIELELIAATGATLGPRTSHQVTIANDILPRVRFATASLAAGEDGMPTVDFVLDKPVPTGALLNFTITARSTAESGEDYAINSEPVEVAVNAMTASVPLMLIDDLLDEPDLETIELELVSASENVVIGAITVLTIELADNDDPPTVSFAMPSSTTAENAAETKLVTVALSAPSGRVITVPFTTGGTALAPPAVGADYTPNTPSPLTFVPGVISQTISVTIINDAFMEAGESIIYTLGSPTNATAAGTLTHQLVILNNDGG